MPKVELGGPAMFVRDFAVHSREFDHSVVGFNSAADADLELDRFLGGYGINTYYLNNERLSQSHLRKLRGTHLVLYDVEARALSGKGRHQASAALPSVYYAYGKYDPEVSSTATIWSRPTIDESGLYSPDFIMSPGVAKVEVQRYYSDRRSQLKGRVGITLLAGRRDSFPTRLAVHLMSMLDTQRWVLLLTEFPGMPPIGLAMAKEAARDNKLLADCKFRPGVAPFYMGFASIHISTGCQRLDAEAGMAKLPVVDGTLPPKEVVANLERCVEDTEYREECIEVGRVAARECDLRSQITQFKNIIKACV
jgi:hypothetical protein